MPGATALSQAAREKERPGRAGRRAAATAGPVERLLAAPAAWRIAGAVETELALAGDEGCRTLLLGSAVRGEGRTSVAIIVGALAAQANLRGRVLLVDADTANPGLSAAFGARGAEAGFAELMRHGAGVEQALIRTGQPNLDLLPAGQGGRPLRPTPEPLEALLRHVRERYDLVLVDAPPLSEGKEVLLLGRALKRLLLVVRSAGPTWREVEQAGEEYARGGAKLLGCLLNDGGKRRPGLFGRPRR